jgi:hypothetical protein
MACHYCGLTDDQLAALGRQTRPYGPGGADVCRPCVGDDPERLATAQAAYGALLDATAVISPTGAVVIGEPSGPRPLDPDDLHP